jgi:hypothetical protein
MFLKLPLGGLEFVLLFVLVGFAALVIRGVRRRNSFQVSVEPGVLPTLTAETRMTGKVRRVFRSPALGLPLVELAVGKRLLVFCPTDHEARHEAYKKQIGKSVTIAAFGLATLEPGGADTIRDQIRDADEIEITPDLLRFLRVGEAPNDYFAIGRVISSREESWGDGPLTFYRLQAAPDLTLEVATPRSETPMHDKSMAHGSVRLFGYLTE